MVPGVFGGQVALDPAGFVRWPHVVRVANAVDCAGWVGAHGLEEGIEIDRRRPTRGDQFERLVQRGVGFETAHQDRSDLVASDAAVLRRAGLARIALQQHGHPLVGMVIVEPARPNDGEGPSARANQSLGPALPVMRLRMTIVAASSVGDTDRGHERDASWAPVERRQHVSDATVVDGLRRRFAAAIGAQGCDHRVHPMDGRS